ncbi:hypothetical protein AAY473_021754 [Plecturocebus cupreus]
MDCSDFPERQTSSKKETQSRLLRTKSRRAETPAKKPRQPKGSRWRPVGLLHWECPGPWAAKIYRVIFQMTDQMQWFMPVVPALWEAEPVTLIEPKSSRLGQITGLTPVVPELGKAEVKGLLELRSLRTAQATKQNSVSRGNTQISWMWWHMSAVPATGDAEHFGRPRRADHLRSGVPDPSGQHGETPSLLKIQKLARCDGIHTPAIPATWEAESRESLELRTQRLQQAEITSLHSSLGNRQIRRPRRADHLRSEVQDQSDQHGETPSLLKIQKITRAWWHMPVIPAAREAEAREPLEPGRWRLRIFLLLKNEDRGQVQLLMPVIPARWEAETGGSPEHFGRLSRVDHWGQEFKTRLANTVKPYLY